MKNRNILFIVEGKKKEPELINKIYSKCFANENYEVFSYETNIHDLIERIYLNGEIDEAFSIQNFLREKCTDDENRKILNKIFSDIFLIFDFDPHDKRINQGRLLELQKFYSESTDNGRLYINFPSIESYCNVGKMPDNEFKNKMIDVEDCRRYKDIVDKTTPFYKSISKLDKKIIFALAAHHLGKFNHILYNKFELNLFNGYVKGDELIQILSTQIELINHNKALYVLNTFILHLFEYQPKKILEILPSITSELCVFDD